MYNGTCPGNNCSINNSGGETIAINGIQYNSYSTDNKYEGYKYGGASGVASTSRVQATTNETNSTIKTAIDNWYATDINGTGYTNMIVDNIFCNDRQLRSEVGGAATGTGFGSSETWYAGYYRLVTNKTPTLKCGLKNDRFTVSDTAKGNGALTYPVGLITADELTLGGITFNVKNLDNYLQNNMNYWTMSPLAYEFITFGFYIDASGRLAQDVVDYIMAGARPIINLSSTVKITGEGSISNPYKVIS